MQITREGMIAWVDRESDERFRKVLIHGCPRSLQQKMIAALSCVPQIGEREASESHFGDNLKQICDLACPLVDALEDYFDTIGAKNFREWLNITGYGNSRALISVFADWAAMKRGR